MMSEGPGSLLSGIDIPNKQASYGIVLDTESKTLLAPFDGPEMSAVRDTGGKNT